MKLCALLVAFFATVAIPALATEPSIGAASSTIMGETTWGDWSNPIFCYRGVNGFRLRVESDQGKGDDTGLNGIQLSCSDSSISGMISGYWGDWKDWQMCDEGSRVTSFTLRSEGDQKGGDDTAANNVRMKCRGKGNPGQTLDGGGHQWGTLLLYRSCPANSYLCGVRARIEKKAGKGDDTGMNQIEFLCCKGVASSIIMGKTTWGDWSNPIYCYHGVTGFRLRVESNQGKEDDTGLNGIQLRCSDSSKTGRISGNFGKWKKWQVCDEGSRVTSFSLRSAGDQEGKGDEDDTAANNVRMRCSGNNDQALNGGGTNWGTWALYESCPTNSYLCGVRARIEKDAGKGDDTGMNQIEFLCCKVGATSSITMGKTDWGGWSELIACAHGVNGFRLRVESDRGKRDDTSLNGIQLSCSDSRKTREIPGIWGEWKKWQMCGKGSRVTSFKLRSEGDQKGGDDTAANNVIMECSDGTELDGGGTPWGEWEEYRKCPAHSYFCGVKAKIEKSVGKGDDTAMNQIQFYCCGVSAPVRLQRYHDTAVPRVV